MDKKHIHAAMLTILIMASIILASKADACERDGRIIYGSQAWQAQQTHYASQEAVRLQRRANRIARARLREERAYRRDMADIRRLERLRQGRTR